MLAAATRPLWRQQLQLCYWCCICCSTAGVCPVGSALCRSGGRASNRGGGGFRLSPPQLVRAGAPDLRRPRQPPPLHRLGRAFYRPWRPGSSPKCSLRHSSASHCRTLHSCHSAAPVYCLSCTVIRQPFALFQKIMCCICGVFRLSCLRCQDADG